MYFLEQICPIVGFQIAIQQYRELIENGKRRHENNLLDEQRLCCAACRRDLIDIMASVKSNGELYCHYSPL